MRAEFHKPRYEATPGEPSLLTLRVVNTADTPVNLTLTPVGLDHQVTRVPRRVGPVPAGRTVEIPLPVNLPVGFAAGDHRVAIEVGTDIAGQRPVLATTTLAVGSPRDLMLTLGPRNVRGGLVGRFDVNLANRSDRPLEITLDGEGEMLRFSFKHNPVTLRPRESARIRAKVRGPRPISNEHATRTFTISARGHSSPVHAVGNFVRRSAIPTGLSRALLFLLIIAVWGAGLFVAWRELRDGGDPDGGDVAGSVTDGSDVTPGSDGPGGGGSGSGGDGADGDGSGDGEGDGDVPREFASTAGGFVTTADDGDDGGVLITLVPVALEEVEPDGGVDLVGFEGGDAGSKSFGGRAGRAQTAAGTVSEVLQTVSADDGEWGFAGIDRRELYRLDFSKPGYDPQAFIVSFPEEGPFELDVELVPGVGQISGRVTGPDGPIGGVDIELTDGALTWRTSTSTEASTLGTFVLADLGTPQHYLLSAVEAGFGTDVRAVDLDVGGSAVVDIELSRGVASLTGTVTATGVPVGGARIRATNGDLERATTSATEGVPGSFVLPGLPTGQRYVVTIEADGYAPVLLSVDLTTDTDPLSVNLTNDTFVVTGDVTGVDTDTGDSLGPLGGAGIVVARDGGDVVLKSTTDDDGTFNLTGLAAGTYVFTFSKFRYHDTSVLLDLDSTTAGRTLSVELESDPDQGLIASTGELTGTIRSSINNDPLTNAVVVVVTRDGDRYCNLDTTADPDACDITYGEVVAGGGATGGTDGTGLYQIEGIPVGIHDVFVYHHLHQPFSDIRSFGIGTRETLNATLLELGSIRGLVTVTGGTPYTGEFSLTISPDPDFAGVDVACNVATVQIFPGSVDGEYDFDAADLVPCHYLATFRADTYVTEVVKFQIGAGEEAEVVVDATLRRNPRASIIVYIPTEGAGDIVSGGVAFDRTINTTIVDAVTVVAPADIEAARDVATQSYLLQRTGGGADAEFIPAGTYQFVVEGGAGYADNTVTITLGTDQNAQVAVPLSPALPNDGDFGGQLFYRTPDNDTHALPSPDATITATDVIVGFDEDTSGSADPLRAIVDDVATTSVTASPSDPASTWDSRATGGLGQVWGESTYSFTHPAFEPVAGGATMDVTVDDDGQLSVDGESDLTATVTNGGDGPIDVELDPRNGTVSGGLLVYTVAPQAQSRARFEVSVDNLDDPAAATDATVTLATAGSLGHTYGYNVADTAPGQYEAQVVGADFSTDPAWPTTVSTFLNPGATQPMPTNLTVYELGRLTVEVVDLDGAVVEGATVTLTGPGPDLDTDTDANGLVTFTGLPATPTQTIPGAFDTTAHSITVVADRFIAPGARAVGIIPGGFVDDDGTADGKLTITVDPLQVIAGTVRGIPDTANPGATVPLTGATVTYRRLTTGVGDACGLVTGFEEGTAVTVDETADGTDNPTFAIADAPGDYYLCQIEAAGYYTVTDPAHPTLGRGAITIGSAAGATPDTVDGGTYSLLPGEGDIDIRVVDDGGTTLANGSGARATACLLPSTETVTNAATSCPAATVESAQANAQGRIAFTDVDATTYKLLIFANAHLSLVQTITVPPGGAVDLDTTPVTLKRQGASINGRVYVVNTATGENTHVCTNARSLGPLSGATVSLFGGDLETGGAARATATTSASNPVGSFAFSDLEDGAYTATVTTALTGIGALTEDPLATIAGQADEDRNDLDDAAACPLLMVAQDGTLTVQLFDDLDGDGVQDGGEGALVATQEVTVNVYHPNDPAQTSPILSVTGSTPNGDGVVVPDAPLTVPALALASADLNDATNRYTVVVEPRGASAFLSQDASVAVTPAGTPTVAVGVFDGVEISGTAVVQRDESTFDDLDTRTYPNAEITLFGPDGTELRSTTVIRDGEWSIVMANSALPAPGANGYFVLYEITTSSGILNSSYIPVVVDKDVLAALGSALPATLTIPQQTLIRKGELAIDTTVDGATVTLVATNGPVSPHPSFFHPVANGTELTVTEADPATPGDASDDTYTYTLGSSSNLVDIDVDPRWDYTVTASKASHADAVDTGVEVDVGGATDVDLDPASLLGEVRVRVRDPAGNDLGGADVTILAFDVEGNPLPRSGTTNGAGRVLITDVHATPAGTQWDVEITSTAYPDATVADAVTVVAGDRTFPTVNVPGGSLDITATMANGSTFPTGGFTVDIDGTGAPGDQTVTTNGGNVTFTGLRDTDYTITFDPVSGSAASYSFSPANGTSFTIPNAEADADVTGSFTVTALATAEITIHQPGGANLTSATSVVLDPPTGSDIAMSHVGSGVWRATGVPALASGSAYDVVVDSIYPDETFADEISFSAPGTADGGTVTLAGGSIDVQVNGALDAQAYVIGFSGGGGTVTPANQTVTIGTTPSNRAMFRGLDVGTWTASVVTAPAGWTTSVSGTSSVGAGAPAGSLITVTASNPAPSASGASSNQATVYDDPCASGATSATITATVTDVAGDTVGVTLTWTAAGGGSTAMTSGGGSTYTATFDPADFGADATATLTVTATDANGGTDTTSTTVDLVATCPP